MQLFFPVKELNLSIDLPASKSISNRALILNALSDSPCPVSNLSDSDDTQLLADALDSNNTVFDMHCAGTSLRFLTAYLSKIVGEWVVTGNERMKQRPVKGVVEALNKIGAKIDYMENEGYPPIRIFGSALTGGEVEIDSEVSSQYISALMMIAPFTRDGIKIILRGEPVSMPYIDMTAEMMREYGAEVNFRRNVIEIFPQDYTPVQFTVEADWSAASYWYAILALAGKGEIFLRGLHENSIQGDACIAELFIPFGIRTEYKEDGVLISVIQSIPTYKWDYDFRNEPDLVPTFVVLCCLKGIPFRFSGIHHLRIKETNRIDALITELEKLGYVLELRDEVLSWTGKEVIAQEGVSVDTYDDHRMAMAFAMISVKQPVHIKNPEVITKSYPTFWKDLEKLAGNS